MVQKITTFKPGEMAGAGAVGTNRVKFDGDAAIENKNKNQAENANNANPFEHVPSSTIRALKIVSELPAQVLAQAIDIARRRYESETKQSKMIQLGHENQAKIDNWLMSRAPDPDIADDWIDIVETPWPHATDYRVSLCAAVVQTKLLKNLNAANWPHFLNEATPYFGRIAKSGETVTTKKLGNGLPTISQMIMLSKEEIEARELAEKEKFSAWEAKLKETEGNRIEVQQRFISATLKSSGSDPAERTVATATATATELATERDELEDFDPLDILAGSDFLKPKTNPEDNNE